MSKQNSWLLMKRTKIMLKKLAFTAFLIPPLILNSTRSWAVPVPAKPINFSCLSRAQKEQIDSCITENIECHMALQEASKPPPSQTWEETAIYVAVGILSGMVIEHQLSR